MKENNRKNVYIEYKPEDYIIAEMLKNSKEC